MDNYQKVKAWRAKNPEKRAEQTRRYKEKHPETGRKSALKYRTANIEKVRESDKVAHYAYRQTAEYKLASAARSKKFKQKQRDERERIAGRPQPDRCEICKGNDFRIVWDHCHEYGHFRGWICDRCNRVLGIVKDNRQILLNMARYLKEHKYGVIDNEETKQSAELRFCDTRETLPG